MFSHAVLLVVLITQPGRQRQEHPQPCWALQHSNGAVMLSQPLGTAGPFTSPEPPSLCLPKTAPQAAQGKLWGWKWWDHQLIKPPSGAPGGSSLQEPPFLSSLLFTDPAQLSAQQRAFRNTRSLDLFLCRSIYSLKWCCKAKSQMAPSFKEQVPEDPTWESRGHIPDWGKRPLRAPTGKLCLMDIFAPQHNSYKHLH